MKLKMLASAAAGLAVALTLSAPAQAARVLDFSGACGGAMACTIGQDYGDDATVDISYRTMNAASGETLENYLRFAENGFGDLEGAVFGGDGQDAYAEIVFNAAEGYELSLRGFDFAGLAARTRASFELFDLDGSLLAAIGYRTPASHGVANFEDDYRSAVVLRWKPSSTVAVDNIVFDVKAVTSAVPEPASWALMIGGFGLAGAALRRRRATLAAA